MDFDSYYQAYFTQPPPMMSCQLLLISNSWKFHIQTKHYAYVIDKGENWR